ncbi:helix-turn-helix domain-containing protein [Rubellicoccus peritrichatus]|uniref:Helix-turn-helix domain-containing protein n=1 Tax=Rubellicoccus peritrichatus TaxID=3080537 RepID=A0AAQ3QVT5_9BACT|nr:helix-turn-helix domain-containing protein [Puniceicoccus sp. CR14]WOO41235.1 helix-turn-helix domain-containing protein [Puniceicoccus sp. CR14]
MKPATQPPSPDQSRKRDTRHYRWNAFFPEQDTFHILRSKFTRSKSSPYHDQDYYDIFFVEEGKGVHEVNGHRHRIERGDFSVVTPEDSHRIGAMSSEEITILNVGIPKAVARHAFERYGSTFDWFKPGKDFRPIHRFEDEEVDRLSAMADDLAQQPRIAAPIDYFLLSISKMMPAFSDDIAHAPKWLIEAMETFRREHLLIEGVDAIVRLSGKTPAHVSRSMRHYFNKTPTDYVNEIRLRHVSFQLLMGTRKIEEIAAESGFNNLPHFFKLFRDRYGEPPLRYRKNHSDRTLGVEA